MLSHALCPQPSHGQYSARWKAQSKRSRLDLHSIVYVVHQDLVARDESISPQLKQEAVALPDIVLTEVSILRRTNSTICEVTKSGAAASTL